MDHEFHTHELNVIKDCKIYAWLIFGEDHEDLAGAMYELGPRDILEWHWKGLM